MATAKETKKAKAKTADSTAAAAREKASGERTYTLAAMKKHCYELLGVPTVVFMGATAGIDTGKNYSVSEIKDIITKWCKKEAK